MEWLSDLVLYTREVWLSLYEVSNRETWPAPLAATACLLVMAVALRKPGAAWRAAGLLALAGCWIWVGVVFHWRYHAELSWVAGLYGGVFMAQGGLALLAAMLACRVNSRVSNGPHDTDARSVWFVASVLVFPLIGFLDGRTWAQLDFFGTGPDTTAFATLLWLTLGRIRYRIWLSVIPAAWAAVSFASQWPLGMTQGIVMLAAAIVLVAAGCWPQGTQRKAA